MDYFILLSLIFSGMQGMGGGMQGGMMMQNRMRGPGGHDAAATRSTRHSLIILFSHVYQKPSGVYVYYNVYSALDPLPK